MLTSCGAVLCKRPNAHGSLCCRCPLTGEVMLDPVRAADGFVYERSAIEQWLALGRKRSPMANTPLSHPYVTPDRDLRAAVQTWLQSQNSASAPLAA